VVSDVSALSATDVVGFDVEALDGMIGKVCAVTEDRPASKCLVVKPGILRKKHVIPAGAVRRVDARRHRVVVRMTRHQIEAAPSRPTPAPWPGAHQGTVDDDLWRAIEVEIDRFHSNRASH
jgi:hypothetical protein